MATLIVPNFASEANEAQWWYDHREEVANEMIAAAKAGKLGEAKQRRAERLKGTQAAMGQRETSSKTAA